MIKKELENCVLYNGLVNRTSNTKRNKNTRL